jgi:hypothetical protein
MGFRGGFNVGLGDGPERTVRTDAFVLLDGRGHALRPGGMILVGADVLQALGKSSSSKPSESSSSSSETRSTKQLLELRGVRELVAGDAILVGDLVVGIAVAGALLDREACTEA